MVCEEELYQSFENFYGLLDTFRPIEGVDILRWRGNSSGIYTVKSYYEILILRGGIEDFSGKQVLQKNIPTKECCFM